jgi:hypothetical protein
MVFYFHFKLIPISQVSHRGWLWMFLPLAPWHSMVGSIFWLGSRNSHSALLCSTFLQSLVFCSALLWSQAAQLWSWVTWLCFPTRAQSPGTGLVGLGSMFLTATQKLREFREVAAQWYARTPLRSWHNWSFSCAVISVWSILFKSTDPFAIEDFGCFFGVI